MLGFLIAAAMATQVAYADWAQWRGPNRDGVVDGFELPAEWPDKLDLVWKKKVGLGYASPVVQDGAVYILSREKDDEVVRRLDLAKGKERWKRKYKAPLEMDWYGTGNHPQATPAVDGDRLVTFGITGILTCWDVANGEVVWRHTYTDEFEEPYPKFGAAVSPLIVDGSVVIHVGGAKGGALRRISLDNGDTEWSWGEDGPGYASPILVSDGDRQLVITQSEHFQFAVDAASGKEVWRIPFETKHDQNVITPLVVQDTLYYSGYDAGTHAMRLMSESKPDSIWSAEGISQYMGSPVVADGLMIGFDHKKKGRLFCLDVVTGETRWLTHGRWGRTASIVVMGDHLGVLADNGQLSFAKISGDAYRTAAYYDVGKETWAHPAFSKGLIVTKDEEHISAWRF